MKVGFSLRWGVICFSIAFPTFLLVGCAIPNGYYEPATVKNGVISNPKVGWNGYTVTVPEGVSVFDPSTANPSDPELSEFQRGYLREQDLHSRGLHVAYTEWFLLEHRLLDYCISFTCSTYELPSPWSMMVSSDRQYFLQKLINDKLVRINDTDAHHETIQLNGHHGWYISGTTAPFYGKERGPNAYEAYFIIGGLKEAYWFEGFAPLHNRRMLRRHIKAMAESLRF